MKKTYVSKYIKKSMLSDTDNVIIRQDLDSFNSMMRTAFSWNNHAKIFDDDKSIHLHLKEKFGCNDYFANSANRHALDIIKSQKELKSMHLSDMKDDIDNIKKAVVKKQKHLDVLLQVLDSIIVYTRNDWTNPAKLKTCQNVHFEQNGRVRVQIFKKKVYFDNLYLFEYQWLRPIINRLKQNIKAMKHKIYILESHMVRMKSDSFVHVCFGTSKLFHDTRLTGSDRLRALRKRKNSRMLISGRKDSKNGNWVFRYDVQTHTLYYKSMNHWNNNPIALPNVEFPYGQNEIETYLLNHMGAVAWEIRDCGNAWQIACIISVPETAYKNDCFTEGCVSYDINYDNISFAELDSNGNLLYHNILRFNPECAKGVLTQQLSHALEKIFKYAQTKQKPIACEKINSIQRKKVYDKNTKRTRHISMFASTKIAMLAANKSNKYSISLMEINPAYTSKTGLLKYKKRYGLSTHEAAAFVIGRRAMGFVDQVPAAWKHKLNSEQQTQPRISQWKAIYGLLSKLKYRDLNNALYPKKVSDNVLFAESF